MHIYKIFRDGEWAAMQSEGETLGAPVDLADGYVHFSTAATVAETAEKYFAGQDGLWLIVADADAMGSDIRWEAARDGALFPHLYRSFLMSDVLHSSALPLVDGRHVFPDLT